MAVRCVAGADLLRKSFNLCGLYAILVVLVEAGLAYLLPVMRCWLVNRHGAIESPRLVLVAQSV